MLIGEWLVPVVVTVLLIVLAIRFLGVKRGAVATLVLGIVGLVLWNMGDREIPPDISAEISHEHAVTSADCAQCHARQYQSWYRTYHRTMTRDATPENVKGDFSNVTHHYQGFPTRLTREGDEFFMETLDPDWALLRARGQNLGAAPRFVKLRVDRLVGSHWIQECFHRTGSGSFLRLPVLYQITEKRWVHSNGAFLTPDTEDFWGQCRGTTWNESCLYCHNTGPSKNPTRGFRGEIIGFNTTTTELGIACAACHGPGNKHVQNKKQALGSEDDDVVHPADLSVARRDEICARCHGAIVPKAAMWDPHTHRDPFIPGQELTLYNSFFWSEAEQAILAGRRRASPPPAPEPNDGRFWGDGTPLTTALEYNGMALSACYQNGNGRLSCLTCHTMHGDDPNYLLKPGMQTNEACYQCHGEYRDRLTDHTRHHASSEGSLCYNCHMPHQVYSLMTTHRSHRIQIPDLASSVGTGKPNACNLCHLDKSLGWTRNELAKWPNRKKSPIPRLSADQETISEAILMLSQGDARSRVVVAGAFSKRAALKASGDDWVGSMMIRLIDGERYPAVRYLGHRALKTIYGDHAKEYDFLATSSGRANQLRVLRLHFDQHPVGRKLTGIPLGPDGLPDQAVLDRLRNGRHDPDLSIHE